MLFTDFGSSFNTILYTLTSKHLILVFNTVLCYWILDFLTNRKFLSQHYRGPQNCVLSSLQLDVTVLYALEKVRDLGLHCRANNFLI